MMLLAMPKDQEARPSWRCPNTPGTQGAVRSFLTAAKVQNQITCSKYELVMNYFSKK